MNPLANFGDSPNPSREYARKYAGRQNSTASEAPAAPEEQGWWYWCRSSNAYYPYVKSCAEGWQKVPPQPAN